MVGQIGSITQSVAQDACDTPWLQQKQSGRSTFTHLQTYKQYLQAWTAFDSIVLHEERLMELQAHIDASGTSPRDV